MTAPLPVPSNPPHLAAQGIHRSFGAARVLRGVDLTVRAGELQVILGPNGAGKTTLLRILAGLSRPSSGSVTVFGQSLREHPANRRELGLLSHASILYDDLTPRENLVFAGRLYRLASPGAAADAALSAVGLSHRADDPVRRLSRGMVQRTAIARALLHQPRVILMDEPFTGLAVPSTGRVLEVLRAQLDAGRALILVTHNLAEVWPLATRVSVLVRGRWVIDEPRASDRDGFVARLHEALGD
ncbi:MAG TPA: heme ABC exporter ATP-binding protein CcmA [Gemmatimonadales bacterium]|nr:heme ABC exporter ATP-binding protein CcmA [Gemmatimonadales bacterium]